MSDQAASWCKGASKMDTAFIALAHWFEGSAVDIAI